MVGSQAAQEVETVSPYCRAHHFAVSPPPCRVVPQRQHLLRVSLAWEKEKNNTYPSLLLALNTSPGLRSVTPVLSLYRVSGVGVYIWQAISADSCSPMGLWGAKTTARAVMSVNSRAEHRYQYSVQKMMTFMVQKNQQK